MLKSKRKKILGVISLLFVITKSRSEESRKYRQTRKLNTSWAVRCWEEWAVERNVKVKKSSSKEKYYEVNPDIKKVANEQLDYWLGKFVLEIRKKKACIACILLIWDTRCVVVYSDS